MSADRPASLIFALPAGERLGELAAKIPGRSGDTRPSLPSAVSATQVPVAAEALAEGGQQLHRRLDVAQVDHLDRRVHVAERDRDDAGGDPGAGDLEDVGVGAGAAAAGADRVVDALRLGGLDQQLEDLGGEGGAAADRRAGAEGVAADLLLVDPGRVGGVGDVDRDRDVGPDLEGGGAGAEEADLLLDGGDRRRTSRPVPRPRRSGAGSPAPRRRRGGCPSPGRRAGRRRPPSARRRSPPGRRPGPAPRPPRGRRRRCRCACSSARPPFCAGRARAGGSACARRRRGRGRC